MCCGAGSAPSMVFEWQISHRLQSWLAGSSICTSIMELSYHMDHMDMRCELNIKAHSYWQILLRVLPALSFNCGAIPDHNACIESWADSGGPGFHVVNVFPT